MKLIFLSKLSAKMDDFDSYAEKILTKISEIFGGCRRSMNTVFDRY